MSLIKKSYGICQLPGEITNRNTNNIEQLNVGDLLRIIEMGDNATRGDTGDITIVKLFNYDKKTFRNDIFECKKYYVASVSNDVWDLLIGMPDKHVRFQFYKVRRANLHGKEPKENKNTFPSLNYTTARAQNEIKVADSLKNGENSSSSYGVKMMQQQNYTQYAKQNENTMPKVSTAGVVNRNSYVDMIQNLASPSTKMINSPNNYTNRLESMSTQGSWTPQDRKIFETIKNGGEYQNSHNPSEKYNNCSADLAYKSSRPNLMDTNNFIEETRKAASQNSMNSLWIKDNGLTNNQPKLSRSDILKYTPGIAQSLQTKSEIGTAMSSYTPSVVPSLVDSNNERQHRVLDTSLISTIIKNGARNHLSPTLNDSHMSINANNNTTGVIDFRAEAKNEIEEWRAIIKPNEKLDNFSVQTDVNRNPMSSAIQQIIATNQNETDYSVRNRNDISVQMVDVPMHKGALPKQPEPEVIKLKKGPYNRNNKKKNKNKQTTVEFIKTPSNYNSNYNNNYRFDRRRLNCHICRAPFNDKSLVLGCRHCICHTCFNVDVTRINRLENTQCPVNRPGLNCPYKLKHYEIRRLREKFEIIPQKKDKLPITGSKPANHDDEEVLFECKTFNCEGKWFAARSAKANLYKCPVCNITNCVDCKIIHENMTCKEYKQSKAGTFARVTKKFSDMVVGFIPGAAAGGDATGSIIPKKIQVGDDNDPDNDEFLMKCNKKNCDGRWYLLNNDKNDLFRCPTCESYNCIKCNAIHPNQTCEEYKRQGRSYNMPKLAFPRYTKPAGVKAIERAAHNTPGPEEKIVKKPEKKTFAAKLNNKYTKKHWSCEFCTYENFSYGVMCQMCGQANPN